MTEAGQRAERRVLGLLLLLAVALTGIVALYARPFNPDASCCDHLFYRSMAYNLGSVTRPELNEPPRRGST